MSRVETHRGKLVPVEISGDTLEEKAEAICHAHGWELDKEYYSTWLDFFEDEGYRDYHIRDEIIYKIVDEVLDPEDFVEGSKNDDGSYNYFISWYNGGAGMSEVLDEAIKKANKS